MTLMVIFLLLISRARFNPSSSLRRTKMPLLFLYAKVTAPGRLILSEIAVANDWNENPSAGNLIKLNSSLYINLILIVSDADIVRSGPVVEEYDTVVNDEFFEFKEAILGDFERD